MIEANYQVAILRVNLHIPDSGSLKTKRQVVKSLKERIRGKFNVSVAEIDGLDKWQVATLAFAAVGNDHKHLEQTMQHVLSFVEGNHQSELCEHHLEFI